MRRHDSDDDSRRSHSRPAGESGISRIAVGVAIGGGVLSLLMLAGCAGLILRESRGEPKPPSDADVGGKENAAKATATYTREQWAATTMGKTREELIALLGRPDSTRNDRAGLDYEWVYYHRVLNPATGKFDMGIVEFQDDRVVRVRWL